MFNVKWATMLKYLSAVFLVVFLATGCQNQVVNYQDNTLGDTIAKKGPDINSGLLLGLVKVKKENKELSAFERIPDDYRTLWIYQKGKEMTFLEKSEGIITPIKDYFWKLENNRFQMSEVNEDINKANVVIGDLFSEYRSYYVFSNIVAHLASEKAKDLYTTESFKKEHLFDEEGYMDSYQVGMEQLLYVGNKYASVLEFRYLTGGGSYNDSSYDIKLYQISDLNNLESRRKARTKLFDLLDKDEQEKLESLAEKYREPVILGEVFSQGQYLDVENLTLKRQDGKWQIQAPLYMASFHQGNGSQGKYITEYLNIDIKVPDALFSHDTLCINWETIKQKIPQAKDAVSSPNKDMLAVLTSDNLLIFANPLDGIEQPHLSIPVAEDEQIILNQWTTGEYIEKWSQFLQTVD